MEVQPKVQPAQKRDGNQAINPHVIIRITPEVAGADPSLQLPPLGKGVVDQNGSWAV